MGTFLRILFALVLGLVTTGASADNVDLKILDPWVQAAPPGVKVLAAYLEIKNNGEKPQVLVGVSSPSFKHIGIHRSVMHGNMAHMEHMKELIIPSQSSVALKPGGLHLMLMDAKKPLNVGDPVPMTLAFKNGEKITFTATVRSGQAMDTMNHQHMDHSEHMDHNH
ncbi:MAG TPA: copper chaperone PCu(A)C [Gallionella sp.]|jgi:copper(I)-binding protein|nr:copper chaperone PCu(A)C [Gallionella sp.]